MKAFWNAMDWERRVACLVTALGILLLSAFLWASTRPGILFKGEFLLEKGENTWQGTVLGEDTTVTMQKTETGKQMQISCASGSTGFSLVGDENGFTLYQDGTELYRGRLLDGVLLNAEGELDIDESFSVIVTASYGGGVWLHNEDGTTVRDTPLLLSRLHAAYLLLGENEAVRGEPGMAIPAALLLIWLVINLWFPQISYYFTIRRWISYDTEPSDYYYASRAIGNIACGIGVLVLLAMGL